jgi:hypothetical protein
MLSKSDRGIWLSIYKFDAHIDWARHPMNDIEIDVSRVGERDQSGRKHWKNNCVNLRYTATLPDRYDDRIRLLIDAIGGEAQLQALIQMHCAQDVHIMMEIPAKSSNCVEDGFLSSDVLEMLSRHKIDLHFWYL